MEIKYNGHLTLEERIEQISSEIKEEYPTISEKDLIKISAMEEINNEIEYNPYLHYKRLSNIKIIINNKEDLNYIKADKEIKELVDKYQLFIGES